MPTIITIITIAPSQPAVHSLVFTNPNNCIPPALMSMENTAMSAMSTCCLGDKLGWCQQLPSQMWNNELVSSWLQTYTLSLAPSLDSSGFMTLPPSTSPFPTHQCYHRTAWWLHKWSQPLTPDPHESGRSGRLCKAQVSLGMRELHRCAMENTWMIHIVLH